MQSQTKARARAQVCSDSRHDLHSVAFGRADQKTTPPPSWPVPLRALLAGHRLESCGAGAVLAHLHVWSCTPRSPGGSRFQEIAHQCTQYHKPPLQCPLPPHGQLSKL
eukprot:14703651-Alexandrium_andersonii.AAC.1